MSVVEIGNPSPRCTHSRATMADIVCAISLTGSITGLLPISPIVAILLPLGLAIMIQMGCRSAMSYWTVIFWMFSIVCIFCYSPALFEDPYFYRRDGNLLVTLTPLIAIPLLKTSLGFSWHVRWWALFAATVNLFCLILFFIGVPFFADRSDDVYAFLFEAHNAAGGFLGLVTIATVFIAHKSKSKWYWFLAASSFVGLLCTASRGSVLALFCALLAVWLAKPKLVLIGIILSQLVMILFISTRVDFVRAEPNQLDLSATGILNAKHVERSASFEDRIFRLYPIAINLWLHSPVFGTGFGSYNDRPYLLQGTPYVLMQNVPLTDAVNSSHAHHSFLHVAAEQGIIGLVLLLFLLRSIYVFCESVEDRDCKLMLIAMFWFMVVSSLTEHRIVTPSQTLPWLTLVGLAFSDFHTRNPIK